MLLISINALNVKYLGDSLIYIVLTNGLLVCITQIVNLIVSIIIKIRNKRKNNNRNETYKVSTFQKRRPNNRRVRSRRTTMLKVIDFCKEADNESNQNSISYNFGKENIIF